MPQPSSFHEQAQEKDKKRKAIEGFGTCMRQEAIDIALQKERAQLNKEIGRGKIEIARLLVEKSNRAAKEQKTEKPAGASVNTKGTTPPEVEPAKHLGYWMKWWLDDADTAKEFFKRWKAMNDDDI